MRYIGLDVLDNGLLIDVPGLPAMTDGQMEQGYVARGDCAEWRFLKRWRARFSLIGPTIQIWRRSTWELRASWKSWTYAK